jgi:hypothetical protein
MLVCCLSSTFLVLCFFLLEDIDVVFLGNSDVCIMGILLEIIFCTDLGVFG